MTRISRSHHRRRSTMQDRERTAMRFVQRLSAIRTDVGQSIVRTYAGPSMVRSSPACRSPIRVDRRDAERFADPEYVAEASDSLGRGVRRRLTTVVAASRCSNACRAEPSRAARYNQPSIRLTLAVITSAGGVSRNVASVTDTRRLLGNSTLAQGPTHVGVTPALDRSAKGVAEVLALEGAAEAFDRDLAQAFDREDVASRVVRDRHAGVRASVGRFAAALAMLLIASCTSDVYLGSRACDPLAGGECTCATTAECPDPFQCIADGSNTTGVCRPPAGCTLESGTLDCPAPVTCSNTTPCASNDEACCMTEGVCYPATCLGCCVNFN